MADRVAVDVNIETCFKQFATVANNRNSRGNANVAICRPLPVAYNNELRNLHRFASPSNSRPILAAQPNRVTLPNASFNTQSTAAAAPTTAPPAATALASLNPTAITMACTPNTLTVADSNRWTQRHLVYETYSSLTATGRKILLKFRRVDA